MPRITIGELHASAFLVLSPFHINFRINLSISAKNLAGILIETALNLCINLGRMLTLPIQELGVALLLFRSYLIYLISVL